MLPTLLVFYSFLFIYASALDVSLPSATHPASIGFKLPFYRVPRVQLQRLNQELNVDIPVTNSQQYSYLVDVLIGGNQVLSTILDTGSSDLWFVSSDCCEDDCSGVKKFNNSSSATFSSNSHLFELKYLLGGVQGIVASDTAALGALQVISQVFGLASKTKEMQLSSTGNSGILGLAFPSVASIPLSEGNPVLNNLFSYLPEPNRFFAFRMGRHSGRDDPSSSLTFGQLDPLFAQDMSSFLFIPVSKVGATDYNYWKIPLLGLSLNSTKIPLSPSRVREAKTPIAVLDTGTTLILGPSVDVDRFWESLGPEVVRKNPLTGLWEVLCEKALLVTLVFGTAGETREFLVDPADLNWSEGRFSRTWCTAGIQANDNVNSGDWLLGDTFLRNVYVTHHGQNSSHPPYIGLLGLTEQTSSLDRFRKERGPDRAPPNIIQVRSSPDTSINHIATICSLSSLAGFLGGLVMMCLFLTCHARRGGDSRRLKQRVFSQMSRTSKP